MYRDSHGRSSVVNHQGFSIGFVFHNEAARIIDFLETLSRAIPLGVRFELVAVDNDSSDLGASILESEVRNRNWTLRLENSTVNNMGRARDRILQLAQYDLIYFVDLDVQVDRHSIAALLSQGTATEPANSKICAWAGPSRVHQRNSFQETLSYLQKTWWGHFGSAQMKESFGEETVSHSPTGHLLVKKSVYLSVGSFDARLDKTGEDLEIHHRLAEHGYSIKWIQESSVIHDVAENHYEWFLKCMKYGLAQTQITKIRPKNWLGLRCLPLHLGLLLFLSFWIHPITPAILAVGYLNIIFCSALMLNRRKSGDIFLLLVGTHFFYFVGELWGVFRPLAKLEISTIKT